MLTYWDLSERQRAELTEADVQTYCSAALMVAGVAKPVPPEAMPETLASMNVKTVLKWSAGSDTILFDTREQAMAFLELKPSESTYDWDNGGHDFKYPKPLESMPAAVTLYDPEDMRLKSAELRKFKEKKGQIQAARDKYAAQEKKVRDATQGIWADWYAMREKGREYEKVQAAFVEYQTLAGGDATLAETFLRKTYGDEMVNGANAWFAESSEVTA